MRAHEYQISMYRVHDVMLCLSMLVVIPLHSLQDVQAAFGAYIMLPLGFF